MKGIARLTSMPLLVEKEIAPLPDPIQKYLCYVGAIGKPKIQNVPAEISGEMKQKEESSWMNIRAKQYNFYDQPTRIFYISSRRFILISRKEEKALEFQPRGEDKMPSFHRNGQLKRKFLLTLECLL